ncbi:MAG: hypothetical protein OXD49_02495 [Candidatus Poribacteria bacterium]|nr:hypothetical protein [Candidatus Poribacteria bacterium]
MSNTQNAHIHIKRVEPGSPMPTLEEVCGTAAHPSPEISFTPQGVSRILTSRFTPPPLYTR